MTRDEMIEDLLTTDVHGYDQRELEKLSDYSLRQTYDAYECFFEE